MGDFGGVAPTAPAMLPQDQNGSIERAYVQVGIALQLLEMAAPALKGDPEQRVAVEEAHLKLLKQFSKPADDLTAAELKYLESQLAPQGRSPMDSGDAIRSQLSSLGVMPAAAMPPTV